jgi:phenylpyruvate tautomerase PptA (4-oxalocrotonate tautomerase family)
MPSATVVLCGKKPEQATIEALHREMATIIERDLEATKALISVRILWDEPGTWSVAGKPVDATAEGTGAYVDIRVAEDAVDDAKMAAAMKAIQESTTTLLGKNILPPYVVFTRVPIAAWGFKGKSIQQIRAAMAA